ncbi:TlpA family protein disulfide reductase [Schwartzia sp. (in: firmicutes)]
MKKTLFTLAAAGILAFAPAFAPTDFAPQISCTAEAVAAPDQSLTNLRDGSVTSIAELSQSKPLFLNFWASWCPPCVGEMPSINEVYQMYGDRVNFAAVSVDYPIDDAYAYLRGQGAGLSLPFYTGDGNALSNAYNLNAIPQSYLIVGGQIVGHHVGGMTTGELKAFIESAL